MIAGFEDGGGSLAKECRKPLETCKSKEQILP